jgi:uncharacterized membrane protein
MATQPTIHILPQTGYSKMDIALMACTVLMLFTSAANLLASHGAGDASTLMMVLSTVAMSGIALLHSLRHLGVKHALLYFGVIVLIELILEQVNIWTNGGVFGYLTYPDHYFGPKIGDVPIAVPLAMCAINWPTYVLVNLILFKRVVVTSKQMGFIAALAHCAILATMHTAWSYCAEPMALANEILIRPTIGDNSGVTHWGVPLVEFRGWWLMTFVQFAVFSFILARLFEMPEEKPVNKWLESAPLVLYGGTAVLLLSNPVNNDLAIGTVFTMITYVTLAFFVLFAMRSSK